MTLHEVAWLKAEEAARAVTGASGLRRVGDAQLSFGGWLMAASIISALAAGSAAAQEVNEVFLDASYLGAPTEWCPADKGVPLVVKMDGPDIVEGPKNFPKTVKERKGTSVRIVDGENTASFMRPGVLAAPDAPVIGRFSAEFQTCDSAWRSGQVTGHWRVIGTDGSNIGSGAFENENVGSFHQPFFRKFSGLSDATHATFGDQRFFTAGRPETKITEMFLAKPGKE